MNNSRIIEDFKEDGVSELALPLLRERATQLTEIIESLSALCQSSHWQVLRQYEFDGDLQHLVSRLEKEEDTTKIFRLQGEIKRTKKYDLQNLLKMRRQELEILKQKIK